ncbi:hypothetical protein Caci_6879 [Catenulispora acidiphila DSM 44928]|uniref:Uncharacterized protein n=1 Tax=Catenulispora acidiphila (strain DSM 44928 / JCM 14897 / NBRC 102108 / NRRL B-24433 / ID139908) TaxID=479433 RepID=C7Q3F2_CATAD|nr:hypothetical protein [Catenulispora acidiphila]ACU75717.1 hypothetical protein Caci_6879 [Catenulispora acidiphila DSM 44928]
MTDTPKRTVLRLLSKEGFSESYGILLVMSVLVGTDPDSLRPETDAERHEWRGHLQGLRAALSCLAMHEAKLAPDAAAAAVQKHIEDAAQVMRGSGGSR